MQLPLFDPQPADPLTQIGPATVSYKAARSILTSTAGFLDGYDFSLNPYSGCTFGCTYCYAAFFSRDSARQATWGDWVQVKENALQLLRKQRRQPLQDKIIYMSSVTDPYQPIERKLGLTRQILQELLDYHQVRLVIQTRSPLVTRDIDLLSQFAHLQVNMTVTTDSEQVRRAFEPGCPGNNARLEAIQAVAAAGISSCVTMTPLLPVEDPAGFARAVAATGAGSFIVQPFHVTRGKFVAGTRQQALDLVRKLGWDNDRYLATVNILRHHLPNLSEGKAGFAPPD
ncbi:MAG: radical SAM protein [Anaerolineales bacterium]|nr:radical SAM protein [Anaerolineales bacterium]